MKKILFCIGQLGGGGAERVLILLVNELAKKKYDVHIMTLYDNEKEYKINDSVSIHRLNQKGNSTTTIIKNIRKCIKKEKPDVIISFEYHLNMKVILAMTHIKCRLIISERNDPSKKGGKFGYKQLRNFLYRRANYLVCQTPDARAYFPKYIQKKAVVIPNPIKNSLPEQWKGTRRKEIVNFCRLNPQKNLKLLIDSFILFSKTYKDFCLTIYGDGELDEVLHAYINSKNYQDKIHIYPAVPDIHDRIIDSYMFVSSSDYEGLSNSMLEAMAIGLPVICTDCPCGGARMVIKNEENGILVPVGDELALADAMRKNVEYPEKSIRMSEKAKEIRKQLTIEKIIIQWMDVIGINYDSIK